MPEGLSTGEQGALVSLIGFMLLVLMGLIPRLREIGLMRTLKMSLSWIIIFAGLLLIVAEWDRVRSALDPASPVSSGNVVRIAARDDGHYYVRALVNDQTVLFMIDTGATDIVLTEATAGRLGYNAVDLRFDGVAETANGAVRVASIRLDDLSVGSIAIGSVPASVTRGALTTNLLGMRFLNTLSGWRVENGKLILES